MTTFSILPTVLQNIIFDYVNGDIENKIIDNNLDKYDKIRLCMNKNAIHTIEKILEKGKDYIHYNMIDWSRICYNKNAIPIIEKILNEGENNPYYFDINWVSLSANKNAIHINKGKSDKSDFLEKNLHKINWENFIENENASKLLIKFLKNKQDIYYSMIDWFFITIDLTEHIDLLELILEQGYFNPLFDHIRWDKLITNKNTFYIIEKILKEGTENPYFYLLDWNTLCQYAEMIDTNGKKSFFAEFIENIINDGESNKYYDKINWYYLSINENYFDKYNDRLLRTILN